MMPKVSPMKELVDAIKVCRAAALAKESQKMEKAKKNLLDVSEKYFKEDKYTFHSYLGMMLPFRKMPDNWEGSLEETNKFLTCYFMGEF